MQDNICESISIRIPKYYKRGTFGSTDVSKKREFNKKTICNEEGNKFIESVYYDVIHLEKNERILNNIWTATGQTVSF